MTDQMKPKRLTHKSKKRYPKKDPNLKYQKDYKVKSSFSAWLKHQLETDS